MKKTILTILVFLMLNLPACAGQSPTTDGLDSAPTVPKVATPVKQNSSPTAAATQGVSTTVELNMSYENAASIELQLLLGTLKLNGTDLAVTQEQANVLLPLWNNLKAINQSMTPAQGGPAQGQGNATPQPPTTNTETLKQIDVLAKQIAAAMTPKQIKAIAEMKITQATAMTIMQEQGITLGGPQPGNGNSAGNGNQAPGGAPPAGGPNSQGGKGGAGAPPSGQQPPQGTPPAGAPSGGQPPYDRPQSGNAQMSAPPAGSEMTPPELIDAVVQLLEKIKAGISTPASSQTSTSSGTSAAYTQNGGAWPVEFDPAATKVAADFKAKYIEMNGKWDGPEIQLTGAYAALRAALQKAGTLDTDAVSKALASGLEFEGPTGKGRMIPRNDMGISATVDSISEFCIKKIVNGKPTLLHTVTLDEGSSYLAPGVIK